MSLKRIALRKGDSVKLCFVPDTESCTLAAFDSIVHERQKSSITLDTFVHGFPLCLDFLFNIDHAPFGEHHIGLTKAGNIIGTFKFEKLPQQPARPKNTVDLSVSQIETIVYSTFEDTVKQMAAEFNLDKEAVKEFFRENLERSVAEPAKSHYKRYEHSAS